MARAERSFRLELVTETGFCSGLEGHLPSQVVAPFVPASTIPAQYLDIRAAGTSPAATPVDDFKAIEIRSR